MLDTVSHTALQAGERIILSPELDRITGKSRVTRWRWMRDGLFPKPVKIGPNSVGWLASEVEAWLQSRISERNSGEAA